MNILVSRRYGASVVIPTRDKNLVMDVWFKNTVHCLFLLPGTLIAGCIIAKEFKEEIRKQKQVGNKTRLSFCVIITA